MWKSGVSGEFRYFACASSRERAPAERDDAAAKIGDRKDDAIAKAIEGDGNVLAGDQEPGLDHLLLRDAGRREMLLQRIPRRRRVAEAKALLGLRRQSALAKIGARLGAVGALQRILEELRRFLDDVVQARAHRLALFRIRRRGLGKRNAGFLRKLRHRVGKAQPLLLDQEGEVVARDAAAETVVAALAVLGVEGRRLLAVERAAGPVIAAARIGFPLVPRDLSPDHLRDRDARADIVQEGGGKAHLNEAFTIVIRLAAWPEGQTGD